jgi:hypothetical protein
VDTCINFSYGAGLLLVVSSSTQCAALTFGYAKGNTAIMRSMGILRLVRACEFFFLRPIWRMLLEVRLEKFRTCLCANRHSETVNCAPACSQRDVGDESVVCRRHFPDGVLGMWWSTFRGGFPGRAGKLRSFRARLHNVISEYSSKLFCKHMSESLSVVVFRALQYAVVLT